MRNIKLTIEYDGTNFNGWQIQANGHRTVQGQIQKALSKILGESVKLIGSGRTDSGVHALGQVANFKTRSKLPVQAIQNGLNAKLPRDIVILHVTEVGPTFHAQYSVKSKTYRYTILNRPVRPAQLRHTCLYYPYQLNTRLMRAEAKAMIGKKDFKSFQAADAAKRYTQKANNTIRNVKRINIAQKGDLILIDIEANGFLYKMVRNMVGTLLAVANGQLPKGSVGRILKEKNRKSAGDTAKAEGLCLWEVKY